MSIEVKELASGWIHVRWNNQCWAQFPKGLSAEEIPDEYIFQPEWNRRRVNDWWRGTREAIEGEL